VPAPVDLLVEIDNKVRHPDHEEDQEVLPNAVHLPGDHLQPMRHEK
jgi:hypothetical protein